VTYELAVIGAGPAGLSAALAAADHGLSVALVDAGERPGGQYYRHPPAELGEAWSPSFVRLRERVTGHPRITHLAGHRVWMLEPGSCFTLHVLVGERDGRPDVVRADRLVLATGAHDRSLPFPGWDLPGVMTAGGAQALAKGALLAAGGRIVVAGSGPFLLPVATGLAELGAEVAGVYEANRPRLSLARALGRNLGKLAEAAGYASALLRRHIPYRTGHAVVAAHGERALEAVTVARLDRAWRPIDGSERVVECDAAAVGYGFTPQLELPLHLGCAVRTDGDGSLVVAVDAAQQTDVPGVWAAGETTGVGGAQLALIEGELAGLAAAGARPDRRLLGRRARLRRFAALLHELYPVPAGWAGWLGDDTVVCRCEGVTFGRLREAVEELGAGDPRTAKLLSRAGMGRCQGRVCGHATARLTAGLTGTAPDPTGLAHRPIAQPIRLGDLAEPPYEQL